MRNPNMLQRVYKNKKETGLMGWWVCTIKGWSIWHEEIAFPVCEGKPWSNKVVTADNSKGVSDREAIYSHPDRWEFVNAYEIGGRKVTIAELDKLWDHYLDHKDEKYGYADILFNWVIPTKWNNKKEWFCDEICRHLMEKNPEAVGAPKSKKDALFDAIDYISRHPLEKYKLI